MFGKKCWSCAEKIPKNAPYVTYKVRVKTQPLATDNYKNYKNRANQTDGGAIGANMSDVVSTMINTANADGGRVSDTLHVHSRINCIKYAIKAVGDAVMNLAGFIRLDCCWHGKKDYEYSMMPVGNDFGYFYYRQGLLGLAPYKPTVKALRMLHDDPAMFLLLYNSVRGSPGFGIPTIVKVEQKAADFYQKRQESPPIHGWDELPHQLKCSVKQRQPASTGALKVL